MREPTDGATWNGERFEAGPLANASPVHGIRSITPAGKVELLCGADHVDGETNATEPRPSKRMEAFAEPVTCQACVAVMEATPEGNEWVRM